MAPATATAIPLAQLAVTNPASPPVRRAMTRLAARWSWSISTNSGAIAAIAAIASGTMMEAPSAVIVPDTLMIGLSPNSRRMSRGSADVWVPAGVVIGGPLFMCSSWMDFQDGLDLNRDVARQR